MTIPVNEKPPHPQFERASMGDLDRILELEQAAASPLYAATPTRESIRQYLLDANVYKLVQDGELIGFVSYIERENDTAYIDSLVIAESARGQGLGRWALEQLLTEISQSRIELVVHPDNLAAVRIYEQAGFVKERELADRFGDSQPRLLMVKINVQEIASQQSIG